MKIQTTLRLISLMICFLLLSCTKKNNAPVINDQAFSIDENTPSGTLVGHVIANDEEDGTNVTYSLAGGNNNDAFAVSADGNLTVSNEPAIDYETTPVFTLLIEVRDSKGKIGTANITVNINDVAPTTSGLILYMPFDGNVNDMSAGSNNGLDFTSQIYVSGQWAEALDFNGTSDYVKLTNTINSAGGLSFSFWVKTRGAISTENNGAIICKYSMATDSRCFMVYSFGGYASRTDNRLSAAFYKYGESSGIHDMTKSYLEPGDLTVFPDPSLWTITNPLRLEINKWTHCIVNVTATDIETWLDGILCTKKQREYGTYFDTPAEPVFIGNNFAIGEGTNNHFNGALDELRIYNRGLTADEIKTLFREK
jgi:hypothetical protein